MMNKMFFVAVALGRELAMSGETYWDDPGGTLMEAEYGPARCDDVCVGEINIKVS